MRTDNAMKTSILIALTCMLVACAVPARAADNVTTNYFAGAVTVLATSNEHGRHGADRERGLPGRAADQP
jgi:hypothetical protein